MSLFKFHDDDIFINTVEGYPEYRVIIHSGSVVIDDVPDMSGSHLSNILDVGNGHISLYQRNIDRPEGQKQHAYTPKAGYRQSFKTYTEAQHNVWFNYDETGNYNMITSSYRHSASVSRYRFPTSDGTRQRVRAVKSALNHNKFFSPHYAYDSMFGNKGTQELNMVCVPSIMYGQRIKKGTVKLGFYVGGQLVGELNDSTRKGELVQASGSIASNDGKVAGVILYNEGVIVLTGSWDLDAAAIDYTGGATSASKWVHFGAYTHSTSAIPLTALSSSFVLEYQGVTQAQTLTMMAHARYGELNHSNNPTYISSSHPSVGLYKTGSVQYQEPHVPIKNIVDTKLTDHTPDFTKETYITKVAIYDERKNLIGIAKVAVPIRKTEDRQYTFKLKLDI
jgi:hypothetical protein